MSTIRKNHNSTSDRKKAPDYIIERVKKLVSNIKARQNRKSYPLWIEYNLVNGVLPQMTIQYQGRTITAIFNEDIGSNTKKIEALAKEIIEQRHKVKPFERGGIK